MSEQRRDSTGHNPKIFISYRRDDSAGRAGRLYGDLGRHFGADQVFMDVSGIEGGKDFVSVIEEKLAAAKVLIAVIGEQWEKPANTTSQPQDWKIDWVHLEITAALARRIPIIPVLLQDATMPRPEDLPPDLHPLTRLQAVSIRDDRWDFDVARLTRLLKDVAVPGALVLTIAVALVCFVMCLLLYYLANVQLLTKPAVNGRFNIPTAIMGIQEVIIKRPEVDTSAGLLLSHVAESDEEIRIEMAQSKLSQQTVKDLKLDPADSSTFAPITYATSAPEETPISKNPCSTSVEVQLREKKQPDAIHFSQASAGGRDYRELQMKSAGAELVVSMSTNPKSGSDDDNAESDSDGPGCWKHLIDTSDHLSFGAYAVQGIVAADSWITFRFTPALNKTLWEGEGGPLTPFGFGSAKQDKPLGLQAHAVSIQSLKSDDVFEIQSVDGASLLRIDSLAVESNQLRVSVSGEQANVTRNRKDVVGLGERFQRYPFTAWPLVTATLLLFIWLSFLMYRLIRRYPGS